MDRPEVPPKGEMVGVLEIDDAHGGEDQAEVELAKEI